MSPELYYMLKAKKKDHPYDAKKNDSFALGMTLLNLLTL